MSGLRLWDAKRIEHTTQIPGKINIFGNYTILTPDIYSIRFNKEQDMWNL